MMLVIPVEERKCDQGHRAGSFINFIVCALALRLESEQRALRMDPAPRCCGSQILDSYHLPGELQDIHKPLQSRPCRDLRMAVNRGPGSLRCLLKTSTQSKSYQGFCSDALLSTVGRR